MKIIKYIFYVILLLFQFFGNNVFSNLEIPDFQINLQRPSYIEETGSGSYICDEEKDECKVNFKLVDEDEKDISSKYSCELLANFELPDFSNICNPTTFIIPANTEQIIKFKIFEKNNIENFREKEILIKNNPTNQQGGFSPLYTNSGSIQISDFQIELQSPSYVIKKNENTLECDGEKDECKINFKFLTLDEKELSSKYSCELSGDFDLGDEANKCNPNTIIIPDNSDHILKIKIFETKNPQNFVEKEIFIDNTITHYLPNTKIEVQGKITKYKKLGYKNMTCYTYSKCGVNFTSGINDASTYYKWDFKNGEKYYGYNPKTVYFKPGFYRIKLITNNKYGNRKVENFKLTVKQLLKKSEQKIIKNNLEKIVKYRETAFLNINQEIKLALKNKENKNNYLVKNINNFSKTKKKIVKKINTNKMALAPGKIVKKIFGKGNKKKAIVKVPVPKIKKLTPGTGTKIVNKKKLAKNIKLRISFQKKNLKISGTTFPKKIVKIHIGKQEFKTFANNTGKYEFKINSNLLIGKYKIKASVYDEKGVLLAQKFSREKNITQKYISQLKSYKYKKYLFSIKKKRKKYYKKNKIKKYKIEKINYSSIIPINKKEKFNLKIFAINTLITIICIILINIVLIRKKII